MTRDDVQHLLHELRCDRYVNQTQLELAAQSSELNRAEQASVYLLARSRRIYLDTLHECFMLLRDEP